VAQAVRKQKQTPRERRRGKRAAAYLCADGHHGEITPLAVQAKTFQNDAGQILQACAIRQPFHLGFGSEVACGGLDPPPQGLIARKPAALSAGPNVRIA